MAIFVAGEQELGRDAIDRRNAINRDAINRVSTNVSPDLTQVVLKNRLKHAIETINPSISEEAREQAGASSGFESS